MRSASMGSGSSAFMPIGVALATNTLTFPFVVTLGFLGFYPATVAAEERRLMRLHGAKYETYQRVTPRFVPAFSRYQRPNRLEIEMRTFQRGLLDALWFLLALMSVHIIMELHEAGHLAAFLKLMCLAVASNARSSISGGSLCMARHRR